MNTPFNVEIKRTDFKPDKDWKCKGLLEEYEESDN